MRDKTAADVEATGGTCGTAPALWRLPGFDGTVRGEIRHFPALRLCQGCAEIEVEECDVELGLWVDGPEAAAGGP